MTRQLEQGAAQSSTSWTAILLVAPIPAHFLLVMAAILWARFEAILLHPANAATNPPTVSRAIADPAIGDVFAKLVLAAALLLTFAIWRIAFAFFRTATVPATKPIIAAAALCQAIATLGMIVLTQYTGHYSNALHTLGSYMLFFGEGLAIVGAGVIVNLESARRRSTGAPSGGGPPMPYSSRIHPRLAIVIAALGAIFAFFYFDPINTQGWNDYDYRVVFAMSELALLISFEVYLFSFIAPMYRYERYCLGARNRTPSTA